MIAPPMLTFAQQQPPAASGVPTWLQVAGVIITMIVGVSTVLGARLTARQSRLQMMKLEQELGMGKSARVDAGRSADLDTNPISVRAQSYLVRFIILSLAYTFWGFFTQFFSTVLMGGISGASIFATSRQSYGVLRYLNLASLIPQIFNLAVSVAIFLAIGWPLLKDILDDMGLRPRIFWFRDVPDAIRRAHETSEQIHEKDERVPRGRADVSVKSLDRPTTEPHEDDRGG